MGRCDWLQSPIANIAIFKSGKPSTLLIVHTSYEFKQKLWLWVIGTGKTN